MAKLYELTGQYNQLWNMIDEDIDITVLEEKINSIEEELDQKVDNLAKLIKSLQGDVESYKLEETRLKNRRIALENKVEGIKKYIESQLVASGKEKIKGIFTVGIQNNPSSVELVNEDAIPEVYISYEKHISKQDILIDLKAGKEVAGAIMKQTKSLRIR